MLAPAYQRYLDRLQALSKEGLEIARLERPSLVGSYIQDADAVRLQSWLTRVENLITAAFGRHSSHFRQFESLVHDGVRMVAHAHEVRRLVGLLDGAADDLAGGFLFGQEFLVAGRVFDSVLEEAKHLLTAGFKDPSAVLGRVVLEQALQRLADANTIDSSKKASVLNDELRQAGRFSQPLWRQVQAWLDIGNAAAHGKFQEYTHANVATLLADIERFLATEFRA